MGTVLLVGSMSIKRGVVEEIENINQYLLYQFAGQNTQQISMYFFICLDVKRERETEREREREREQEIHFYVDF